MPVGRGAVKLYRGEGRDPQAGPSNPTETSFPHCHSSLHPASEPSGPHACPPTCQPPPPQGVTSSLVPLSRVEEAAGAPASPPS